MVYDIYTTSALRNWNFYYIYTILSVQIKYINKILRWKCLFNSEINKENLSENQGKLKKLN